MQRGTERRGNGSGSGERIQTEYDIPDDLQKVRLRVLRKGDTVMRKERSRSQQYKRERCEDGEIDIVLSMRIDRIFADGLNRENAEINGKHEMK